MEHTFIRLAHIPPIGDVPLDGSQQTAAFVIGTTEMPNKKWSYTKHVGSHIPDGRIAQTSFVPTVATPRDTFLDVVKTYETLSVGYNAPLLYAQNLTQVLSAVMPTLTLKEQEETLSLYKGSLFIAYDNVKAESSDKAAILTLLQVSHDLPGYNKEVLDKDLAETYAPALRSLASGIHSGDYYSAGNRSPEEDLEVDALRYLALQKDCQHTEELAMLARAIRIGDFDATGPCGPETDKLAKMIRKETDRSFGKEVDLDLDR